MLWNDYLDRQLSQETVLDNLLISVHGKESVRAPEIIKASILISDKMIGAGRKNMIVFPEQKSSAFLYVLLITLFNISEGRIKKEYNPYSFVKGEKLGFRNSVVEFDRIDIDGNDRVERIFVSTANGIVFGMPLEIAPFLQRKQTKRLSKYESFKKEYNHFKTEQLLTSSKAFIQDLSDYKTHLETSSVFVAPILTSKGRFLETSIDGKRISDFLLLAQADPSGNIGNMTSGQLAGAPAIVLCQDLYIVNEALGVGLITNTVFAEASQNSIENQLDALDDLIRQEIPIVLLADQISYSDYSSLESRGFHIWTWNENTITPTLYSKTESDIDIKARNAALKRTAFIELSCPEISVAILLLNKNKRSIEDKSAAIIQVYQDLFEIALMILRTIMPLGNIIFINEALKKCKSILIDEEPYISVEMFSELMEVVENIAEICGNGNNLPKAATINSLLLGMNNRPVTIIIPQNTSKNDIEQHLSRIINRMDAGIKVVYPGEYHMQTESIDSHTIVSGWFNRSTMNKIINANIAPEVTTLLYECEKQWKNGYLKSSSEASKRINTFNADVLGLIEGSKDVKFEREIMPYSALDSEFQENDEVEEIELTLRQSKYRRFISPISENSVEANPVSFVGDLMAFYRAGHSLLIATKLINEDYENIEEVKPSELDVGDFVIEREVQRDLIRDIADIILKNSGYLNVRTTARKWKEALEVELTFSDEDVIFEKLKANGCNRCRATVRKWLFDNGVIKPQSKEDVIAIARSTDDPVLLEMVDEVFEAGMTIKSAHIQAGHYLAEKLKSNLATALAAFGNIDGFNVWQPIELDIEDIGRIKILKVIDVGETVFVDATITNRLIDTNRIIAQGD